MRLAWAVVFMVNEPWAVFPPGCASCSLRGVCLPRAIGALDSGALERMANARRRLRCGDRLFNAGDLTTALYAVHSGSFKILMLDGEGREQVTGFCMGGDLLGVDGLESGRYQVAAHALETSEVCALPLPMLDDLARRIPDVQRHLYRSLSREIVDKQSLMLMLGSMRAEARVAAFLTGLGERFAHRGYSACEFELSMTRSEIGSFLGLTLETVSRLLSRLQRGGIIELHERRVRVVDPGRLHELMRSAPGRVSRS